MGSKTLLLLVALVGVVLLLRPPWRGGVALPDAASLEAPATSPAPLATTGEHAGVHAAADVEREIAPPPTDDSAAIAIVGSVEEPGAGGVGGAAIELLAAPIRHEAAATLSTATTDADGRFRIVCPRGSGPWVLRASASHYQPGKVDVVDPGARVRLRLKRILEVFGCVLDKTSSNPIVGAKVRGGGVTVESDALGRYELAATSFRGNVFVTASANGFAEATQHLQLDEPERTRIDLLLSPAAPMTVQVVDRETEAPIAGADVRQVTGGEVLQRCDTEGRFVVAVGEGQRLSLTVAADGYCQLAWSWQVAAGSPPSPRLPLLRDCRVEGCVTDAAGAPLESASVHLAADAPMAFRRQWSAAECERWQLPGDVSEEGAQRGARTDANGRYVVSTMPGSAERWIDFRAADCVPATSSRFVLSTPGQTARVDVALAPGGIVRGAVTCNGQPFAGNVTWRRGERGFDRVRIDTSGDYELRGVPPGAVELQVRGGMGFDPHQSATVQVVAGEEVRQDFAWDEPLAAITGRVTLANGEPAADVGVRAVSEGHEPGRERHVDTVTDAAGHYVLQVPVAGVYSVSADSRKATAMRTGVRPNTTGVDLVLPAMGVMRLRLVDAATGAALSAIPGFSVMGGGGSSWSIAWRPSGQPGFRTSLEDVDSTGLLLLRLPVGLVDIGLAFQEQGYAPRLLFGLLVPENDSRAEVRVELERGAELRLSVTGDEPFTRDVWREHLLFALEDAQVSLVRGPFPEQGGESNMRINGVNVWLASPCLMQQMPNFDAGNHAALTGLLPGRYRVLAFPDDLVFEPETFTVGPGDTDVELRWRRL